MFTFQKLPTLILLASLILTACGQIDTSLTPTVDLDTVRTQAVASYVAGQTQAAKATPVSTFTPAPLPTDTPSTTTATVTRVPQSTCYNLLWIKDVTIPDNTKMKPGEKFTKTWQVQNTGGCAWAPGFTFNLIGGEAMSGRSLTLTEPVPVGAKTELSIDMVAPTGRSGIVAGTWQMFDLDGYRFGDALSVYIDMGGTATGTPTTSP